MTTEVNVTLDDEVHSDLKEEKDAEGITWKEALFKGFETGAGE